MVDIFSDPVVKKPEQTSARDESTTIIGAVLIRTRLFSCLPSPGHRVGCRSQ